MTDEITNDGIVVILSVKVKQNSFVIHCYHSTTSAGNWQQSH